MIHGKLVILVLLCIAVNFVHAQEWFPQGARWYYNQVYYGGNSYQKFDVIGEALIKGKICKVITGACQCSKYDFLNYLYQDGQLIYLYNQSTDEFRLLYNFSLVAGDTLTITGDDEGDSHFLIDSISQIMAGSLSLKVQHIHLIDGVHQLGNVIYERIGAEGCLYPVIGVCDHGTAGLRCYEDAVVGLINFQSPPIACDYVSAVDQPKKVEKINVFPNPSTGTIYLHSDESIESVRLFQIASGTIVFKAFPSRKNPELHLPHLSDGTYILMLTDAKGNISIKKLTLLE